MNEFSQTNLNEFLTQRGYHAIPFVQNAVGHLLIEVVVNGIPGLFILDTGAGSTIVDLLHVERLGLTLNREGSTFGGAGAGGQGMEVIPTSGNKVEIGAYIKDDFPISVMSLFGHLTQAFAEAGVHEELAGVIGVDILYPGKAVIDYDTMHLYLDSSGGGSF